MSYPAKFASVAKPVYPTMPNRTKSICFVQSKTHKWICRQEVSFIHAIFTFFEFFPIILFINKFIDLSHVFFFRCEHMVHMSTAVIWTNDSMRQRPMCNSMVSRNLHAHTKNSQGQLVLQELCSSSKHAQKSPKKCRLKNHLKLNWKVRQTVVVFDFPFSVHFYLIYFSFAWNITSKNNIEQQFSIKQYIMYHSIYS